MRKVIAKDIIADVFTKLLTQIFTAKNFIVIL